MKLRVTLLALLIAGMAGLAFFLVKPGEGALVEAAAPFTPRVLPDPQPPPAPPAETEEHRAARLSYLDPTLREAIIRLENAVSQWEEENPDSDSRELDESLILEIAKLETSQLDEVMLADALGKVFLKGRLGSGLCEAWAYRDPAMARNSVLATAEAIGILDGGGGSLDGLDYYTRRGHARRDPAAAWKELLDDLADPRRKHLGSEFLHAGILEFYAKLHPEEAWRDFLARPDLTVHLLPGFAMGAPPGQDWPARLTDYAAFYRSANGREPGADWAVNGLLSRWLSEDPDAALAWVDSHLGFKDFLSADKYRQRTPPPKLPGLEAPPEDMLVRLEMMREVHGYYWRRKDLMIEILTALIAKGHRDLAAMVIADRLDGRKSDCRLHALIRSFPDPAMREALLVTAIRKIPKPASEVTHPGETEHRLAAIYSLWTLSADIEVSEEARRRARTRLRVAYAAEQSAAGQQKSSR